jgi:Uma2 family endonuclease
MEVVSDDKPSRDWKTKRAEYAQAGIREYWIVDPRDRSITVLSLPEGETVYREAGRYTEGQTAASALLEGFRVDVTEVFQAE